MSPKPAAEVGGAVLGDGFSGALSCVSLALVGRGPAGDAASSRFSVP